MKLLTSFMLALALLFIFFMALPAPITQAKNQPETQAWPLVQTQPFSFTEITIPAPTGPGLDLDFMGSKAFLELMGGVAVTTFKLLDKYEVLKFLVVIAILLWLIRMIYAFVVNRSRYQTPGVELGDAIDVSENLVEDNNFDDGGYLGELDYVNRNVF